MRLQLSPNSYDKAKAFQRLLKNKGIDSNYDTIDGLILEFDDNYETIVRELAENSKIKFSENP